MADETSSADTAVEQMKVSLAWGWKASPTNHVEWFPLVCASLLFNHLVTHHTHTHTHTEREKMAILSFPRGEIQRQDLNSMPCFRLVVQPCLHVCIIWEAFKRHWWCPGLALGRIKQNLLDGVRASKVFKVPQLILIYSQIVNQSFSLLDINQMPSYFYLDKGNVLISLPRKLGGTRCTLPRSEEFHKFRCIWTPGCTVFAPSFLCPIP